MFAFHSNQGFVKIYKAIVSIRKGVLQTNRCDIECWPALDAQREIGGLSTINVWCVVSIHNGLCVVHFSTSQSTVLLSISSERGALMTHWPHSGSAIPIICFWRQFTVFHFFSYYPSTFPIFIHYFNLVVFYVHFDAITSIVVFPLRHDVSGWRTVYLCYRGEDTLIS